MLELIYRYHHSVLTLYIFPGFLALQTTDCIIYVGAGSLALGVNSG